MLHDTQGGLGAASLALGSLSSAEQPTAGKFRSPMDYATAVMRALSLGNKPDQDPTDPHSAARTLLGAYSSLGQPLWTAPLPNGWSDLASDWSSPADLLARTDWSWRLSAHAHTSDPLEIANATLGPALRKTTYTAMRTAGSRQDALTLLFSSPEFQRR